MLLSAHGAIQQFDDSVEMTRLTLAPSACRERMTTALDAAIERTQDFTDSAYTSHEHRENILLLWDRVRSALTQVIRAGINLVRKKSLNLVFCCFFLYVIILLKSSLCSGAKGEELTHRGVGNGHKNAFAVHARTPIAAAADRT